MVKGFFSRIIADAHRPANMAVGNQNMQNHRMVESPVFTASGKNISKGNHQVNVSDHVEQVFNNSNQLPLIDRPETTAMSQRQSHSVHIAADTSEQRKNKEQKKLLSRHHKASIELDTFAKPVQTKKRDPNSKKARGVKDDTNKLFNLPATPEVTDSAKRFAEPPLSQIAKKTDGRNQQSVRENQVEYKDKRQSNMLESLASAIPKTDTETLQSTNEGYVVESHIDREGVRNESHVQDGRDSGLDKLVTAVDFPESRQSRNPVESESKASPPQVSIGRIDVVVVASQSRSQQPQAPSFNGFSSRNYLRKL